VDCAGGFVAHGEPGVRVNIFSDATVVPEVDLMMMLGKGLGMWDGRRVKYIAAANTDIGDADEDVVRVEGCGDGFVF
jgi:hypothetical protein